MAISKKLETIYYNGQPDGIRSIRRHLSTMTTYVIPRPLLAEAKKISNTNRPGIYYLISENDNNKIAQLYVGQTRNGIIRLDDHNRSKDFWNKAIMFLADSKTFTLDMISGLEAYAINKATDAKRYKVENTVNSKYEIDEYDERFLRHLALGYTKDQITQLRGMPFGVKSLEKRQNELVQKLFPDGNNGMSVNATRLAVRALELHIIDIDNLRPDEE